MQLNKRSAASLKDERQEPHGAGERTVATSEVDRAMLHASRTRMRLVSARGGQAKAARHVESAPEQLIAARRLDSIIVKVVFASQVECLRSARLNSSVRQLLEALTAIA